MDKIQTQEVQFNVASHIEYSKGSIVSQQITYSDAGNITLFAFDRGQQLSEHTAPYDAVILVVEGEAKIRLAGVDHHLKAGDMLIMHANTPHAVFAEQRFKMLLTMIKG